MSTEDKIVLINGKKYTLGEKIGGGLEGEVYNVKGLPKYVIKIINDHHMDRLKRNDVHRHLEWLLNYAKEDNGLRAYTSCPKALLDNELGYIMRKTDEHESLNKYLQAPEDNNEFQSWFKDKYTLKKRYQIIINIFRALRVIHEEAGLVFTDLSPNNIMVNIHKNQVVFIDTDNLRRATDSYRGVQGTPGYMAPELYRKPDEKLAKDNNIDPALLSTFGQITFDSDVFSAAVIAFQLLTLQHPFVGDEIDDGEPELEEEALAIKTDYIFKENTKNPSTKMLVPMFNEFTTPEIRKLFEKTFVDSIENPHLRPTDLEFIDAFQDGLDKMVVCDECGFSKIYQPKEDNVCIGCGKQFDPLVNMIIYAAFSEMTMNEIINNIGDDVDHIYDVDTLDSKINYKQEISRVILQPAETTEENIKVLYMRHFETCHERTKPYLEVRLNDAEDMVGLNAYFTPFKNAVILSTSKNQTITLADGKTFPIYKHKVIFSKVKHGNGHMYIIGEFVKE